MAEELRHKGKNFKHSNNLDPSMDSGERETTRETLEK
jgi:hypothetical protein